MSDQADSQFFVQAAHRAGFTPQTKEEKVPAVQWIVFQGTFVGTDSDGDDVFAVVDKNEDYELAFLPADLTDEGVQPGAQVKITIEAQTEAFPSEIDDTPGAYWTWFLDHYLRSGGTELRDNATDGEAQEPLTGAKADGEEFVGASPIRA